MDIFDILGTGHGAARPAPTRRARPASAPWPGRCSASRSRCRRRSACYGSFAETGPGHGTDRALVAGLLGMKPDDLRIPSEPSRTRRAAGLQLSASTRLPLRDAHPEHRRARARRGVMRQDRSPMQAASAGRRDASEVDKPHRRGSWSLHRGRTAPSSVRSQDESGAARRRHPEYSQPGRASTSPT